MAMLLMSTRQNFYQIRKFENMMHYKIGQSIKVVIILMDANSIWLPMIIF